MSAIASAGPGPLERRTSSKVAPIFTRLPILVLTAILLMVSLKYLISPLQTGAAAGISFTSPGGVTVARVGFGGFPLAFAAILLVSLFSRQHLLTGLRTELMLLAIVIGVRLLGMTLAHSTETAKLLLPELVLAALCIFAIRLERDRRKRERFVAP